MNSKSFLMAAMRLASLGWSLMISGTFAELLADKAGLEAMMKKGADEAAYYARKTLSKVQRKLGFVPRP